MKHFIFFLTLLSTFLGQVVYAAAQEIHLVSHSRQGDPQRIVAEKFKELLEAESGGSFTVTLHFFSPDLNQAEAIDKIQTGVLQMGILTAASLENLDPITRVPSFPFLFTDEQQAARILDGPLGATILRDIETIGCKGLAFADGGFRHLTNNIRPVHTLDDLKGLKIRVMSAPLPTATWLALGAEPVPMPWPIYAELEEGLLDGQENPLWIVESYNLFEVQHYLTLSRHRYAAIINVASLKWWQTLSTQEQDMIQTVMIAAARLQRQDQLARETARLALLKSKGMIIDEQPDSDAFRNSVARLKELPIYREPRVQVLLTQMLHAALLVPDPPPPVDTEQEGATAPADQAEGMQEPLPPEQPSTEVPAQKDAETSTVPGSTTPPDPFDTPMLPLMHEQADTDAQSVPLEIPTNQKPLYKALQAASPEQQAGAPVRQPTQQPTDAPLHPVDLEPFTVPDDGSSPTAPATGDPLPPIVEERVPPPTERIQTQPAAVQPTEGTSEDASLELQKPTGQTALPQHNEGEDVFPAPGPTPTSPPTDNPQPIESTSE
jgi:tripartite ATP-independent transporter DctP family solute receptor